VGFNESPFTGLNAGLGLNLGKVYLGIAYSGDVLSMPLWFWDDQPFISKDKKTSDNTLNVLVGTGIIGIKLGFSEFIENTYRSGTTDVAIKETSFKPSLEVGVNAVSSDKFRLKPSIRFTWDIHHYDSALDNVLKLDYSEPAVGVTVGFEFNFGKTTKLSFDIIADAGLRLYDLGEGATSEWTRPTQKKYEASAIDDLRLTGSLPIVFSAAITDRVSYGIKLRTDADFNRLRLVQTGFADARTRLILTSNLGAGVRFNLLPEHFAVYGGLEVPIFENWTVINETWPVDKADEDSFTSKMFPNVKLAIGVTVNFTKNAALELLAKVPVPAVDRNVESPKFSVSFTVKN
jgi:hypothetical protein